MKATLIGLYQMLVSENLAVLVSPYKVIDGNLECALHLLGQQENARKTFQSLLFLFLGNSLTQEDHKQCDQIWRFFALWATF